MEELPTLFKTLRLYKSGNTHRCYSCCDYHLTDLRSKIYQGSSRYITLKLLDDLRLRDTSLAIWFLESGGKTGRGHKNAYLNTTIYGQEGSEAVCDYFNIIGCECHVNRNKDRRRVVFTIKGTETLFKYTANLFPTFMYHRL